MLEASMHNIGDIILDAKEFWGALSHGQCDDISNSIIKNSKNMNINDIILGINDNWTAINIG